MIKKLLDLGFGDKVESAESIKVIIFVQYKIKFKDGTEKLQWYRQDKPYDGPLP